MLKKRIICILAITIPLIIIISIIMTQFVYWGINASSIQSVDVAVNSIITTSGELLSHEWNNIAYSDIISEVDQSAWRARGVNHISKCAVWSVSLTYHMKDGKVQVRTYEGQEHTLRGRKYYSALKEKVMELYKTEKN